jgi:hypothetical protein
MGQARAARAEVKLRLDKDLKDVLEAAAERRGTSLNAEIVARLESSRRPTASGYEHLLGGESEAFCQAFALALKYVSEMTGAFEPISREQGWMHSPYAFDQAARAAVALFEAFRPTGDLPDFSNTTFMNEVGMNMTGTALRLIAARSSPWAQSLADKLGEPLETALTRLNPTSREDAERLAEFIDTALRKLMPQHYPSGEVK